MWVLRRFVSAIAAIWFAATLAFFALRALPGDAITAQLIVTGASAAAIEDRRTALGLDAPLLTQYISFWARALRGDLGVSLIDGQPVSDMILRQLEPTVVLAVSGLCVAVILGLALGCAAGLQRRWASPTAHLLITLTLSVPLYWTGTLAITLFAAQLGWLPSGGAGSPESLILPALVLGFHTSGGIARVVEAGVSETLSAALVATARAKGLRERVILLRHVLRASLPPVVTVIGLQAGFLLGGVVITESLFARPGLGRLLLDATLNQNYPVVQGIVLLSAVVYTITNTLADTVSALLDPRVRLP